VEGWREIRDLTPVRGDNPCAFENQHIASVVEEN
jgi:hypothetical protein